jgi:hypothetical protein
MSRLQRALLWVAAALVLAAVWSRYRTPAFLTEWMSLLSACFA